MITKSASDTLDVETEFLSANRDVTNCLMKVPGFAVGTKFEGSFLHIISF